jgi:RHS repeat-associated protein
MTRFVYDDSSSDLSRLLVSTDSNGQSTYYIYGIGLLGEQGSSGNYLMYHYDLRGSTTAITNKQNTVTDRYTYGSYGELLSHTGTSTTPFLYNGRDGVMTDSNGLNYMRARYYSPTLKRFINADTLKGSINDGETLNNYAYANGNPISMVDPFGRCADEANDASESIFSEIGGFSSNLYNKLNDDTIYVTGYDIDFNLNALSMGEYGALAETGEDVLKGADELGEFLSKGAGEAEDAVSASSKPNQVHHFATNKSKKYTQQLDNIASKYELDLDDEWNKELMPHQGRHPYAYHDYVLDQMSKFDSIAKGDKDKFLKLYDQMKQKIISNPDMLTKDYWNK